MGRRKRSKKGSNSSIDEKEMFGESSLQSVTHSIDCLKKLVTDGFAKIHEDMDKLRIMEFKEDLNAIKKHIGEIEESLQSTQSDVESLRNEVKNVSATSTSSFEELNKRIVYMEKQLKLETEKNTQLEQYTRRENLRFNNIKETEKEDCKSLINDILQRDLKLDTSLIKFHAVHRVGKIISGRTRLIIIVRFVCREDRNLVWLNRIKIKQYAVYPDVYITEDFARAIQEERKVLIKAMMKAKDELGMNNVKVLGRYLFIDNQRYEHNKIPDILK